MRKKIAFFSEKSQNQNYLTLVEGRGEEGGGGVGLASLEKH